MTKSNGTGTFYGDLVRADGTRSAVKLAVRYDADNYYVDHDTPVVWDQEAPAEEGRGMRRLSQLMRKHAPSSCMTRDHVEFRALHCVVFSAQNGDFVGIVVPDGE